MNHIYRLVWNHHRRMLVAVAELTSSHGKDSVTTARPASGLSEGLRQLPGVPKAVVAALMALFPLMASAQYVDNHQIAFGSLEQLSDLDSSNSAAASWYLKNDGTLDIQQTAFGTSLRALSGSGTVLMGGKSLTITDAYNTYAGTLQGSGSLVMAHGNETLSGTNSFTGSAIVQQGGTLLLSGSGGIASASGVVADGVFHIAGTTNGARIQSLSGSGGVWLGDQTLTLTNAHETFAGVIEGGGYGYGPGSLAISGGIQVLSGQNAYNGTTTIADGATLALSGSGSIAQSSGVLDNGLFDIAATSHGAQIQSLSGSGSVWLGAQTLTLTAAQDEFAGAIYGNGSGGLALAGGNLVLSGVNAYSGTTVVAQGANLVLSGSGSIAQSSGVVLAGSLDIGASGNGASIQSLSGSGSVWLGGQTLTLTNAHDSFAGTIAGTGAAGLAVSGGSQVLSGATGYEGQTTIGAAGRLALSGSGSIALSSGVLDDGVFDIAATTAGAQIRSLSGSGAVLLGAQTLTLTQAADTFAGSFHGSGGATIAAGSATFTGTSDHAGVTRIEAGASLLLSGSGGIAMSSVADHGVLDVSGAVGEARIGSLSGSGAVLLGGQTLTLMHTHDNFDGTISGSGGLAVAGGSQVLSGTNTYTGSTRVDAGASLKLSGSGSLAISSGVVDNGVLDLAATNGAQVRTLSGSGTVLLGSQTLTLTEAGGVFAGSIQGSGGVALAGSSATLAGSNTYSGATAVAQDTTLALAGAGSIGNSRVLLDGTLDVSASNGGAAVRSLSGSGAVLLGGQTLTLTGASDTFGGFIGGSGGLAVGGGVLTLASAQGYTGSTTVGKGATLVLGGANLIAGSSQVVADGTLRVDSAGANIKSLAGSGRVLLGGQSLTLNAANGVFSGSIEGSGGVALWSGTETLAGTNTYSGATVIGSAATLALRGQGSIASSREVVIGGTLDISGTDNGAFVTSISGAGRVKLGERTLSLTQASGDFGGIISGAGGLDISGGNFSLSAANTYTGATTIGSGASLTLFGAGSIAGSTVRVNGDFSVAAVYGDVRLKGLSGNGNVLLGTKDLTITQADGKFSGVLAGSGGLNLSGGKLALTGSNSYTGKTLVSGGATLRTLADANLGKGSSALELRDGTWQTGADLTHERGLLLSGRGTVDVDTATVTTENGGVTGSGALVKAGEGTLILRGVLANSGGLRVDAGTLALGAVNTYTGGTTIGKDGTLRISSDANLGAKDNTLTVDGGRLQTDGSITSSRAIAVTARNGVLEARGAGSVVTLDGNITGDGRLVKDGEGTLVLAGDNAGGKGSANRRGDGWTGGLTINDGLVKVTNAYGLGWGSVMTFNKGTIEATVDIATGQDIRMGRSTTIDTAASTTTTLTGGLLTTGSGDGCFTKTGLGTLNVTGVANIATTCVMQGKLLANGSFTSKVTVAQGATLGGSGTIAGDVLVRGTLSPGNSPGMLTADSTITMASGSTYREDIGGTTQASAASPVGAAGYYSYLHLVNGKRFTIEPGATLAPTLKDLYTPQESGYGSAPLAPQLGQTFRIVTADGGISGRFDTLAQPAGMDGMRMAAFYDVGGNRSIELKVLPDSYARWMQGSGANGRSVAAALDRIVTLDQSGKASAQQDQLLYGTASASAAKLGGLVRGLAGEVHGALAAAAPQAGWDLQRSVLKHGAAADGRALWLDLSGNRGKWAADDAASGFHADRVQITAGLDLFDNGASRVGIGASHAHSDLSVDEGSAKLRQNKVFVYGETGIGGVTVDAIGSIGRDNASSQRRDPLAPASGLSASGRGDAALLGIGARTEGTMFGARVEPYARATVQRIERDAAQERPASVAALTLDGVGVNGTRLVTGISAASANTDPLRASTYRFNLGVGIDAGALARPTLHAALAGTGIEVAAPQVGRGFLQGSVNGTLQLRQGTYLYFGLSGEARSGYYQAGGNAGVRAVF